MRLPPMLAALVVAAPLALPTLGCNEAKLIPAPDSGSPCAQPTAIAPCKPLDAGVAGCTGDLGSSASLGQDVMVDASYPPACKIIVNYPVADEDNQCFQLGTCTCLYDGGPYSWVCQQ